MSRVKSQADYVSDVKRQVLKLIQAGDVPATVASFSDLHDYVDANVECLSTIDQDFGCFTAAGNFTPDCETDGWQERWNNALDMANAVMDDVDIWLKNGRQPALEVQA